MKFFKLTLAVALLVSGTEAASLNAMHHHHPSNKQYLSTLPDVRANTVADADIAAHELARREASKVKKNPIAPLLATLKADINEIGENLSFGVSFSQ
jgi:hypothetical protein